MMEESFNRSPLVTASPSPLAAVDKVWVPETVAQLASSLNRKVASLKKSVYPITRSWSDWGHGFACIGTSR